LQFSLAAFLSNFHLPGFLPVHKGAKSLSKLGFLLVQLVFIFNFFYSFLLSFVICLLCTFFKKKNLTLSA
jgi:hypothetical protein